MKIFMLAVNGTIVSVPYRGATFLNIKTFQTSADSRRKFPSPIGELHFSILYLENFHIYITQFPSPIGELHFSIEQAKSFGKAMHGFRPLSGSYISQLYSVHDEKFDINSFRPLSGSYISQYHPRNPMSCLGRIGGLRGKSNFIEIQPFWKVKSSHKSSI